MIAGLELNIANGGNCAVENVFGVETGVAGNEQVLVAFFVSKFGDAAIVGDIERQNVVVDSGVIDDHGFYVAALDDDVGFGGPSVVDAEVGESRGAGLLKDEYAVSRTMLRNCSRVTL